MLKYILTALLFVTYSEASVLTLTDILQHAKEPTLLSKTIEEEQQALEAKNLANSADAPFVLHNGMTRAKSKVLSGYEYDVAISKELKLGNIQGLEQQQNRLNNQAYKLEQEKYLIEASNRLKNFYHQYCLESNYRTNFQKSHDNFVTLYEKKKSAYGHDEIAKTELLQLELEKKRLHTELENLKQKENSSKEQLLSLTTLDSSDAFSCQDMYPIVQEVNLENDTFQLSQKAHEKRIESTQVGLNRYSKKLESVEVSMGYTKELETDLYTVGVSIPLNFSTNKSEQERAALMHQSSALMFQNEHQMANRKYELRELKARLSRLFQTIHSEEENIEQFTNSLLPLMKKSYDYGESSVIEYLLSQQKLNQLQQALLENQKGYYETLFQLYSMSEQKDK
ncbi:TolC family protein [bacterium]|nr:TolC family protein [bacterium]MBU1958175.1 TolC family protein [bacterium]